MFALLLKLALMLAVVLKLCCRLDILLNISWTELYSPHQDHHVLAMIGL